MGVPRTISTLRNKVSGRQASNGALICIGAIYSVANLIGYSYRKLGDYKVSQIWYERALKTDPDHIKTWQYCGLWRLSTATASRRNIV